MTHAAGRYHVTVRGTLTLADLNRLERTCRPALEYRELPLEIHFADSLDLDDTAVFFLSRLSRRGAVITGPTGDAAIR